MCSGPHGGLPEGLPLCPAPERFIRDSFIECQADLMCALLSSSGLTECHLLMGLAAESATQLIDELRNYINTLPHLLNYSVI